MKHKKGLCTGYIDRLYKKHFLLSDTQEPCYFKCLLKESIFKLPIDSMTPIIMVGAGCGIAPFIGFIEERQWLIKNKKGSYGLLELYFGCRSKDVDFLYKQKITKWKDERLLNGLHVAFSREQEVKVYVQDLLKGNKKYLYELIKDKGAIIAVCGSIELGEGVNKAMIEILSEGKAPKAVLEELEKRGKYIMEIWNK